MLGDRRDHRFLCCKNPTYGYQADTDFVGMMNLYQKWKGTFVYPRKNKTGG